MMSIAIQQIRKKGWIFITAGILLTGLCGTVCAQAQDSTAGQTVRQKKIQRLPHKKNTVPPDVRTKHEYRTSHIPGSVPIDRLKTEHFKNSAGEGERIPKKEKPDLEAITSFKIDGENYLLIFGSGSKPNREVCFLVKLTDPFKDIEIEEISLKEFYASLRENDDITGGRKLNIEAAASNDDTLILFQRGNKSGKNVLLYFSLKEFFAFLKDKSQPIPKPKIHQFELPLLKGIPTGFSGAGFLPNSQTLIFTASAEDTENQNSTWEKLRNFVLNFKFIEPGCSFAR